MPKRETEVKLTAKDYISGTAKKAADSVKTMPDEKTVELKATDGVTSVISKIKDSLSGTGGNILGNIASVFTGNVLTSAAEALGSVIGDTIIRIKDLGTETQKTISRFKGIKGGLDDAADAYREFNNVGRDTTFDLNAVQDWGVMLVGLGYSAKNAASEIKLCADTAAGLGKGQPEAQMMVETIARMRATGEATSRQIVALQMAGMDLDKAFGAIGLSAEQAMTAMDEGTLDAQTAVKALTDYMHEFDGSMAASKDNILDLWGDVTGNIQTACGEIGAAILDALTKSEIVQDLIDITQDFVDFVRNDGCGSFEVFGEIASYVLDVIRAGLKVITTMIKAVVLAVGYMGNAFRSIGGKIANYLAPILEPLSKIWNLVKSILTALGQNVVATVDNAWNDMFWRSSGNSDDWDLSTEGNRFRNVKRDKKNGKSSAGSSGGSGGDRLAERIAQKIQEEYKKALENVNKMAAEIAEKIAATNETKEQASLRKLEAERVKYYNKIAEYKRAMDAAQNEEEKAENEAKLKALDAQWTVYEAARKAEIARQADTAGYDQEMQHIQNLATMQQISTAQRLELENEVLATRRAQLETLLADTQINADCRAEIEKQLAAVITQTQQNAAYNMRDGWAQALQELANRQINFKDSFVSMFDSIGNSLVNLVSGTESAKNKFKNFCQDITKTILQAMTKIIIQGLITKAILGAIGMATGGSSITHTSTGWTQTFANGTIVSNTPHYAAGGSFSAGQTAIVGEKGPEIVRFGSAGRVYNNQESRAMLGGGVKTIRIELKNESGTALETYKSEMSLDDEDTMVMSVWMRGVSNNLLGARDFLTGLNPG